MARRRRIRTERPFRDPLHPEWLEARVPRGFWNDHYNQKRYLKWLGKRLRYKRTTDWYRVSQQDFEENRGTTLLNKFNGSPSRIVITHFPTHDWKLWLFHVAPNGFWADASNRRDYMDWLGKSLGFRRPDDWYAVTLKDFEENRGAGMLKYLSHSVHEAVMAHFPKHDWKPWLFPEVTPGFWESSEHQQRYVRWLGRQLKFRRPFDWYRLTSEDLERNHGRRLLFHYDSSPARIVEAHVPECEALPWLFSQVPKGFWQVPRHRRQYMDWLGQQLGFHRLEDWYGVTQQDFLRHRGAGMLNAFGNSPTAAVMATWPAKRWQEWRFTSVPQGFWSVPENRRRYLIWFERQLGIRKPADWYGVTANSFRDHCGSGLLAQHFGNSVVAAARECHPEFEWQEWMFMRIPSDFWNHAAHRKRYLNLCPFRKVSPT